MGTKNFSYDDFLKYQSVSRETYSRLQEYVRLLEKWQKTINLVAQKSLEEVWTRHIIDSTQLLEQISPQDKVADLGSGAGLPGLVLAIMGVKDMTLIESDTRKSVFLKEAARAMGVNVQIINSRVEETDISKFTVITARGFAPLNELIEKLKKTLKSDSSILLLKGKSYDSEMRLAKQEWIFDEEVFPSVTDKDGVIISLKNIRKRGSHD